MAFDDNQKLKRRNWVELKQVIQAVETMTLILRHYITRTCREIYGI
jgi:hypothetical protein